MKQRNTYERKRPRILLILILSLLIPATSLAPAQTTRDYPRPGDRLYSLEKQDSPAILVQRDSSGLSGEVRILGKGFRGFEAVDLAVYLQNSENGLSVLISRWLVFTDKAGYIESDWTYPVNPGPGEKLILIAKGAQSRSLILKTIAENELAAGADIDQCANGGVGQPPVQCKLSAWVNGNLNPNQAHYLEGQVVPFRTKFTGLSMGTHTIVIGYDTTEGGNHAYDFLARYDYTQINAEPCDVGPPCMAPPSTYPIPNDPNIPPGGPINPPEFPAADRYFTMWGGTITAVGTPTVVSGDYSSTSRTTVAVTFTATAANPVLAWGGHLATRMDWGYNHSAAAINGSPFHMRLIELDGSGGNQDRSIQSGAVTFPARITIIKHATPPSTFEFQFTATNLPVTTFNLVDNSSTSDPLQDFTGILDFTLTRRISELLPYPYTLQSISCEVVDVEGITGTTATVVLPYVDIFSQEASTVTCTFFNDFTTAATVDVAGRVFGSEGIGLKDAWVSMTGPDGVTGYARTNQFGYFNFWTVEPGQAYWFTVAHKTYLFEPALIGIDAEMKRLHLYPSGTR